MHHRSMSPGVEEMEQPVGGDDAKARASRGEQEQSRSRREEQEKGRTGAETCRKGNVETKRLPAVPAFFGVNLRDRYMRDLQGAYKACNLNNVSSLLRR